MTEYKIKVYTKKKDLTNNFLKLKYDFDKFKTQHKTAQSAYSFNTKYHYSDKIKELENTLKLNKLSVQKINKCYIAIKRKKAPTDRLERVIVENFVKDFKLLGSQIEIQKNLTNDFYKRRVREKQKRSKAATESNKKIQEARRLIPVIFNFIKSKLKVRRPELSNEQLDFMVERIMGSEHFDYYLELYKNEVHNPEKITRNRINPGVPKGYEHINTPILKVCEGF